ncbi:hypothetical protein Q3A66_08380 [Hymenobacter sp. BT770]|uniref:bestrophin-like domain n=1 Tax=Hymenobacter sp. BT770 TaxID=2886942 RepID=UPI001D0FDBEF|nr:hypothetical protein [Hymenobacter sp. BT770]MCC3153004.1 hypothetical protein [Hymenobacter sp. BT770]MDO3415083.1 hypothetical protein [Hymenobacter sp. BT770]
MDTAVFISALPSWALFVLVVGVALGANEAGFRLGRLLIRKGLREPEQPVSALVGAILGLLAFLLAFTFAMTSSRFDTRRELVIEDANRIRTAYQYTRLLPEKQGQALRKLFPEYVALRLNITSLPDLAAAKKREPRTNEIQRLMWEQAASLAQENMDSELRSLFINSLSEVFNVHTTRKTVALNYHIPGIIWAVLNLLSAMSMLSIGYQTGMFSARRLAGVPVLAASFALVITVIAAMDATVQHGFKISQQPMAEVMLLMQSGK